MCPGKTSDLAQLAQQMRPGTRLLGLDVGAKTVGVAVSDARLGMATRSKPLSGKSSKTTSRR